MMVGYVSVGAVLWPMFSFCFDWVPDCLFVRLLASLQSVTGIKKTQAAGPVPVFLAIYLVEIRSSRAIT